MYAKEGVQKSPVEETEAHNNCTPPVAVAKPIAHNSMRTSTFFHRRLSKRPEESATSDSSSTLGNSSSIS